ncbi:MAG: cupin domain-containing protein [Polyangiaceae bacterium]|nr:cupin domain-containing protein [Polyangiaceae bacterium]NUQ77723.1 cupin domain-containing protein [Polyangiaceae bacterium]
MSLWDRARPHDRRAGLFGGRGAVRVWDLAGEPAVAPFSAVLACELEPSSSVGRHVQQRDPEMVVVLEGTGVAHVDREPRELKPGVCVEVPFGKSLALENGSDVEPLRYLIIKAR